MSLRDRVEAGRRSWVAHRRRWAYVGAAVLAVVGLVVGLLVSTSGSDSSPANERADIGATARVGSGEPECAKPTGQSVHSVGATGPSGSTTSLLGGEGGGGAFLTLLGESAFAFGEDEGLGWLLNIVTGGHPGLDPAQIDQQFDTVNTKLDSLAQQQYDDCTALLSALAAAKTNSDKNAYDGLVDDMADQVGLVVTYQQDFDNIVAALGRNGGDVNALNSGDKDDLRDMISGGPDGLRNVINTINVHQVANSPGAKAMVLYFSQILTDQLSYDPYQTHVFPAAFVDAGSAQQGYYAALLDQAAYLYTNVEHLDFTDGSYTHTSGADSNADVVSLVNAAQADLQSWSTTFSDGPSGDWVSQGVHQGIGAIPADTVLDYRIQNDPRLWTTAPVGLNGDPATPAPYYCASTVQFCYADRYNGTGQVGASSLVRPSPQPLAAMVSADHDGGLSGWRVPTTTDWNDLQAGATGGLTAWGAAHQLNLFDADTLVSHYNGTDQNLTAIAPVLVNTGTQSAPSYSVLTSTDPAANTLTLEKPDLTDSPQNDVAGRVFLVQDFQPTPAPKPFTTDQVHVSDPGAATLASARTTGTLGQAATEMATAGVVLTSSLAPTRFSNPTACSAASKYPVPAGVGSVQITATGGAGAAGLVGNQPTAAGGMGGTVTETIPVTAGDNLYVQVGGAAGGGGDPRPAGIGGGGRGGDTHSNKNGNDYSGGGGGASGVATTSNCSRWLIVAGGGGGGGAGLNAAGNDPQLNGGHGGNGCATLTACAAASQGAQLKGYTTSGGGPGGAAPSNHGGAVGRTPAGSPYGTDGTAGATMSGGDGGIANSSYLGGGGGGGGGGYYGGGGGGGAGWNAAGGGGGGGASFGIPGAINVTYGLGAAGQNGSVTITPIPTPPVPITFTPNAATLAWGQPVRLTATVPADFTSPVGFYADTGKLGVVTPRNGTATFTTVALPVGVHVLHVSADGDDHYLAASSVADIVTVTKGTPAMELTISGTVLPSGQNPKSLVVHMPTDATGTVGFYNDINGGCDGKNGPGAKCQGEGVAAIQNGYATLTTLTVPLVTGKNYLHASYSGDSRYQANGSNTVTVTLGT
jgi:Bacterial Ig-like domain (group 3)